MLERDLGNFQENWQTRERPGYLGKRKDEAYKKWDSVYGVGNWRIVNEMANGEIFTYGDIIYRIYVPGYEEYIRNHPDEAKFITSNYSYGYDKNPISRNQAFDIYALYNKPGIANQFHHVAFNLALCNLGYEFKGFSPLQVREGKPGTAQTEWPSGWKWSPGRIPCTTPDLIPNIDIAGWWMRGSIEEAYQKSKALQVRVK